MYDHLNCNIYACWSNHKKDTLSTSNHHIWLRDDQYSKTQLIAKLTKNKKKNKKSNFDVTKKENARNNVYKLEFLFYMIERRLNRIYQLCNRYYYKTIEFFFITYKTERLMFSPMFDAYTPKQTNQKI